MTRSYKSSLVLLLMMLCCGVAYAQSHMTFYDFDGQAKESWLLQDISKVTFEGGNIVVTHLTGTDTAPIGQVMSIKFTDEQQDPTSVAKIDTDANQVRVATDNSSIRVLGATHGSVTIWSVTGQQIYSNRDWSGEEIDISHLEHGIYIININNTTLKFKK